MKTLAVALSGGIDSALSAFLLKKEGCRLIGIHADFGVSSPDPLPWLEEITSFLKIPLEILPLKEAFQQEVVDYFVSEYTRGRTPNPCVVCNPTIKFGLLFQRARALGAEGLATGHYARIVASPWGEGLTLARGKDQRKEQSYFLHRLQAQDLNRIHFPLGDWTKDRVRIIGREIGLPINPGGESQDICFLPQGGYRQFLSERLDADFPRPGEIWDIQGNKLGHHQGLFAYTIGQRRGLGLPAPAPYYVVRMEPETNRLIVGGKKDLESKGAWLSDFHWLCPPPALIDLPVLVQIRYRHQPAPATLIRTTEDNIGIRFHSPQSAVTPGQAAVVYWQDHLLGGGWIEEIWNE